MALIVDTHAHIYDADEIRYPMIDKPHRPTAGIGDIEHLRRERTTHGLHRVVLVQTGSAYKWDNRLLADTARANAEWTTGVCNLDPNDPASPDRWEQLVAGSNVRGLRLEVASDGRYLHGGSRALMATAQRLGAVICAHLHARSLPELDGLLAEFPEVPVVLDHSAYPPAAEGPQGDTVNAVVALARHANLHTKITFLVTSSGTTFPFDDTHEIAHRIIGAFGPERCMWGSDFPCEHWLRDKASYADHLAVAATELGLAQAEVDAVLGGTAMGLWFPEGGA